MHKLSHTPQDSRVKCNNHIHPRMRVKIRILLNKASVLPEDTMLPILVLLRQDR